MSNYDHAFMVDLLTTLQYHGFNAVNGILGYIRRRPTDGMSNIPH